MYVQGENMKQYLVVKKNNHVLKRYLLILTNPSEPFPLCELVDKYGNRKLACWEELILYYTPVSSPTPKEFIKGIIT